MTWKSSLARAVAIAANNPQVDHVMQWVHAAWAEGQTYEALGDNRYKSYVTLDMKLAQGMMIMLNKAGEKASRFRDKVNLKTEEATRKETLVTGRQLVFMLLESFKTFDRSDLIYGFDHLGNLKVKDHNLHEFLMTWNHIIDNMGKLSMQDYHFRDVFYRKIKDEPEMEYDIKLYERMNEDDPKKTYEHLKGCVQKIIQMQEQRKNLAEREALLTAKESRREGKTSMAVPAASGTQKSNKINKKGETQDKASKSEQVGQEMTPNAKAKSEVTRAPGLRRAKSLWSLELRLRQLASSDP